MKYKNIEKFPHCNYRANVPWVGLETWIDGMSEELDLQLDPPFQRGHIWSDYQRTAYMEYLLKGGRSSKIIKWVAKDWPSTGLKDTLQLLDGKQRLQTIRMYLRDEVRVFGGYVCSDYDRLTMRYDLIFEIYNIPTQREVVELYLALNTGGSIHTPEDLKSAYDYLTSLT